MEAPNLFVQIAKCVALRQTHKQSLERFALPCHSAKKIFITFRFFLQVELPVAASAITRPRTTGSTQPSVLTPLSSSLLLLRLLFMNICTRQDKRWEAGDLSFCRAVCTRWGGQEEQQHSPLHKFPFSTPALPFSVRWERKEDGGNKGEKAGSAAKAWGSSPVCRFILSVRQNGNVAPNELNRRWIRLRAPLWECRRFLSAGRCRGGWTPSVEIRPNRAAWWRERT